MTPKLVDSWEGPYVVQKCASAVNYVIAQEDGAKQKVVHINMIKTYHDRELDICAVTIIADDHGLEKD